MIKSVLVRSCCPPLLVEAKDFHRSSSSNRVVCRITRGSSSSSSSGSRSRDYIPKLEPFSRTKLERVVKDPPLIEKSEIGIAGES
uniref:Uncharacterized protein n=1 Tax=Rhizophora mucronata TaxID=61149 RepID=A0A2P2KRZ7_RHIMU